MKDLQTRQAYRRAQRIAAAQEKSPLTVDPSQIDGESDEFEDMTIANLKDWLKAQNIEMPKEITLRDDILAYVRNANAALGETEQKDQGQAQGVQGSPSQGAAQWNSN